MCATTQRLWIGSQIPCGLSYFLAHVVCGLGRTVSVASLIEHIKTETSKWTKKASIKALSFSWQKGYGAFSISQSNLDAVLDYVERQEEHHRRRSIQGEFQELCKKNEVPIDERYVWD